MEYLVNRGTKGKIQRQVREMAVVARFPVRAWGTPTWDAVLLCWCVEIAYRIIVIYNYTEPEVHPPEMQFYTVDVWK